MTSLDRRQPAVGPAERLHGDMITLSQRDERNQQQCIQAVIEVRQIILP